MRSFGQFQAFYFISEKDFTCTKSNKRHKGTTEQKQKNANKQLFSPKMFFKHIKTLRFYFLFGYMHFVRVKSFSKKTIKRLEIPLMT